MVRGISLLLILLLSGCEAGEPVRTAIQSGTGNLIMLHNGDVELGVMPHAGGRIMLLRRTGGQNVILSNPADWERAPESFPKPTPESHYASLNGHAVWLGPQSLWWSQQDVNKDRLSRKAIWPPDPYLTLGAYRITERDEAKVVLESPASPVSGLIVRKTFQIMDDGRIVVAVTGRNAGNRTVSWDLWSNTRLPGDSFCYVPLTSRDRIRIEHDTSCNPDADYFPYEILSGFFRFAPEKAAGAKTSYSAKMFVNPPRRIIAAFVGKTLLVKDAPSVDPRSVHPDHRAVEIFQQKSPNPGDNLLELEFHSEYKTLRPGDTLTLTETWKLYEYDGRMIPGDHVECLKKLGYSIPEK